MARRGSTSRKSPCIAAAALAGGVRAGRKGKRREIKQGAHPEAQWRHNPRVGLMALHGGGYHGRSLCPRQVLLPVAGKNEGSARSLRTGLGEDLVEAYRGKLPLLLEPGPNRPVAVKIIGDRGTKGLRVVEVG